MLRVLKWLLIAITCSWVAVISWDNFVELRREAQWPTVEGRIVEAGVEYSPTHRGKFHRDWIPQVKYEYSVEGRKHMSGQIGLNEHRANSEQQLRANLVSHGWQVGDLVTVHYDPGNEGNSVIFLNGDEYWLAVFIVSGALGVISIGFGIRSLINRGGAVVS